MSLRSDFLWWYKFVPNLILWQVFTDGTNLYQMSDGTNLYQMSLCNRLFRLVQICIKCHLVTGYFWWYKLIPNVISSLVFSDGATLYKIYDRLISDGTELYQMSLHIILKCIIMQIIKMHNRPYIVVIYRNS
jgi:hypothetical protein